MGGMWGSWSIESEESAIKSGQKISQHQVLLQHASLRDLVPKLPWLGPNMSSQDKVSSA